MRHDDVDCGQGEGQKAQVLEQVAAGGQGVRGGIRHAFSMDAARIGGTEKKNGQHSIDQQEILDRIAPFLAAECAFLFKRITGA